MKVISWNVNGRTAPGFGIRVAWPCGDCGSCPLRADLDLPRDVGRRSLLQGVRGAHA
jgi:hypothetical protein